MSTAISPGSDVSAFGLTLFPELNNAYVTPGDPLKVEFGAGDDSAIADDISSDEFDYLVLAGEGADTIATAAGDDAVFGELGDDVLFLNSGDDYGHGGEGNDRIFGNGGDDLLFGGKGDDFLNGGLGSDRIKGGSGNDTIVFNNNADTDVVTGGSGEDVFRLATGQSVSRVTDFNPNEDTLEIARGLIPGSGLTAGVLKSGDFEEVENAEDAEALIVYERSSGVVYYNPQGGSLVPLVKLESGLNLSAADFKIY